MSTQSATAGIVVAGGGTAGHVFPAIAVMQGLVDAGVDRAQLHYMGAKRVLKLAYSSKRFRRNLRFGDRDQPQTVTSSPEICDSAVSGNNAVGDSVSTLERESSRLSRRLRKSPGGDRRVVTRRPIIVVSYDRTPGRASRLAAALVNRNAGGVRGLAASKGCGRWCPTKALDTFG